MIDPELRDQVLGYYSVPSAIAMIDAPFRERRMIDTREGMAADELQDDLTRRHEFAHYRQIMTTPFGFLLWRCFKSLISDVEHIAVEVSKREPLPKWRVPIHRWVMEGGLSIDPTNPRHLYLLHVCNQVDVLQDFLGALIGRPVGLTVGAFLGTCRAAFAELCRRSDLDHVPIFCSRRSNSELLYGPNVLSGAELMEAATRLEERLVVESFPDSKARLEQWEATAIFGVYEPGYRWLMAETSDAQVALALLDVAFMAPFDLAFMQGGDEEVFIEDLLPSLRLPRLVKEAKRYFWSSGTQELDQLMGHTLCDAIGLESPHAIAARGAEATYNGPSSWGIDFEKDGGAAALNPRLAFDYFDSECRRAMQLRSSSPSVVHREPYTTDIIFRPAVIFYRDVVIFGVNDLENRENGFMLVAALFRKFLNNVQLLRAIGLPDDHDLGAMRDLLWRRLSEPDSGGTWMFDVANGLRQNGISDERLRELFFGHSLAILEQPPS